MHGKDNFTIFPSETGFYELIYSPIKVGRRKGMITFIQENLGEVWYELNLVAEENPVVRVPKMKAELGKNETF